MGMVISIFLGILIFGYAGWMMIRFIRTSRKGKCATCAIKEACAQKDCHCGEKKTPV
jgi:hypothetical protein